MISKNTLSSITINIGTFLSNFFTSLFIVRQIGETNFYSDFLVFTAFSGTFLFLSGSLKEAFLYSNKDNPNFIGSLRFIVLENKNRVALFTLIFFLSIFLLISYSVPDPLISFLLCSHIITFYLSELIQFTSVLTNQVDRIIQFRFTTSILVLFLTWIGLKNDFYSIIYVSLLINTLLPLILFLRIIKHSTIEKQYLKVKFSKALFFIISWQYLSSSFLTLTERYFIQKSYVDLNSYSISLGLVQNLAAVFLSYVTIKAYSVFIKEKKDEAIILRYSGYLMILIIPICLTVSLQNEPFINLIYGSRNNSELFLSNISSSIKITIWSIPAMTISTIIGRYLMSINKINIVIISAIIGSTFGILGILIIYYFFDHNYLRYCWMISQNLSLIILLIGMKQSLWIQIKEIFPLLFVTTIICFGTSRVYETEDLLFNCLEMLLSSFLLFSNLWIFKKRELSRLFKNRE